MALQWVKIGVVTTRPITDVTHRITGEARVGSTLGLTVSEAAPGQKVEVRWYADGKHIATGETLEVTDARTPRTRQATWTGRFSAAITSTAAYLLLGWRPP
ncbi:hypothetical protein [Mumia zhuanghuii]|uniref:Uncharacterized protein n=1 Tax=Mumia zhuanghuii TaxID=2585211 RepID=A0A5C4MUL4_9ACTN|nr:hypothetical protein [Mumia zhuanghuii]TNC49295.1 hypothetical protein FHE65_05645 [Mumia zhuanghuii]TNC49682.1 hypothetical protein FHE65_05245 [Mumia zhuanghuii]